MKQDGTTMYFWDPKTNEFGVKSEKGVVTYYTLDGKNAADYWRKNTKGVEV